jgi:hypothetical protein
MAEHNPAYCLLCLADTPHDGLVTLPPDPPEAAVTTHLTTGSPAEVPARREALPGRRALDGLAGIDAGTHDLLEQMEDILDTIEIAEEEIEAAQARHREKPPERDATGKIIGVKGPLWRSFRLLEPKGAMASKAEFVHRGHCREVLDRVAHRQDTRPATDAEMIAGLCQVSLAVPLRPTAFGLYQRLFTRRFPDQAKQTFGQLPSTLEDYEHIYGSRIDEQETWLRHRARQDWRCLPPEVEDPHEG